MKLGHIPAVRNIANKIYEKEVQEEKAAIVRRHDSVNTYATHSDCIRSIIRSLRNTDHTKAQIINELSRLGYGQIQHMLG